MTVSNAGQATASNVVPGSFIKGGSAGNPSFGSPVPVSATLAAGQFQVFTYTALAVAGGFSGPWNLDIHAGATGTDINDSVVIAPVNSLDSNSIQVVSAAALAGTLVISPSARSIGQLSTVVMNVQNTGGTTAKGVQPSALTPSGSGGMLVITSPSPADIPPGVTISFTWTYNCVGGGAVSLAGNASGTDFNSGFVVSSPAISSNTLTIQSAANLQINNLVASPAAVGTGGFITVVMTVQNAGEASANSVSVTSLAVNSTGGALVSNPGIFPAPTGLVLVGGASQGLHLCLQRGHDGRNLELQRLRPGN